LEFFDELVEAGLARKTEDGWAFVHPMLRESVEIRAHAIGRKAGFHTACADSLASRALAGERGMAERLGRHLIAAGQDAKALLPLLQGARQRRESSDYGTAEILLAHREAAIDRLGERERERADGELLRARIALHRGDAGSVLTFASRVLTYATQLASPSLRTEGLRFLGDAERRRGDLLKAEQHYMESIALLDRVDDPHGVAASLWGLADVRRRQGRPGEQLLEQSRALFETIGDAHGVADHDIGIGDRARQSGDFAGCVTAYSSALIAFEALGNRYGIARAENGLGDSYRSTSHFDQAMRAYERARVILESLDSVDVLFVTLNRGLLYLGSDHAKAAIELEFVRNHAARLGWSLPLAIAEAGILTVQVRGGPAQAVESPTRAWITRFSQHLEVERDLAGILDVLGAGFIDAGIDAIGRELSGFAAAQWTALNPQPAQP
jgi:tetratricopeptide (TPR) repeat protein